jgi:hypothetical protein
VAQRIELCVRDVELLGEPPRDCRLAVAAHSDDRYPVRHYRRP